MASTDWFKVDEEILLMDLENMFLNYNITATASLAFCIQRDNKGAKNSLKLSHGLNLKSKIA